MNLRIVLTGFVAAAAIAIASSSIAQGTKLNVRLGLWETTSVSQTAGMPSIDLSNLPPEARARAEAAMKAREAMQGTPQVQKYCLTKEKLEKELFQEKEMDPSCKRTTVEDSATVKAFRIECTAPQKMAGDMRFEAVSPTAVKGTIKFNMDAKGSPMTVNSTFTAKWLGEACGDVK